MPFSLRIFIAPLIIMLAMFLTAISITLLLSYAFFLGYCLKGMQRLILNRPSHTLPGTPFTSLTVVIPFRNEAGNLPDLIASLLNQIYPEDFLEILLIDDHSDDYGRALCEQLLHGVPNMHLLILPPGKAGKKDALSYGIEKAKNPLIVTTDADARHSPTWLQSMAEYYAHTGCNLIIGPVILRGDGTFFGRLQVHEFLSIQLVTAGFAGNNHAILCNGANLVFEKQWFDRLGGHTRHRHHASGDDIFLLREFLKHRGLSVGYHLRSDAIATASTQPTLKSFLAQRVRWASKMTYLSATLMTLPAALIFVLSSWTIILLFSSFFRSQDFSLFFIFITVKFAFDTYGLMKTAKVFGKPIQPFIHILSLLLHPFYVLVITLSIPLYRPMWKGRPLTEP